MPETAYLTREERKSLTHGEFWIPEAEREVYRLALATLNQAGIAYVVSGLYAIYEYTGIYRQTKDLDVLLEPAHVVAAARALRAAGFHTVLEQAHWLAKAYRDEAMVDLIFGMGNGLHFIDADWYRHSRPAILAATPVRVAPPEELIWHRLFISERHRTDISDMAHLLVVRGRELDWERLLERSGDHWRLLLAQLHFFDYVYPGHRECIPPSVREDLYERAYEDTDASHDPCSFRGTLVSRFSFAIDVNEWGFRDPRTPTVAAARRDPRVGEIVRSDVWDDKKFVQGA
ncbi:MAG: nucleotidyltransferase family protein [Gemmatimonadetes bacterium]|nr:nucleotidyltransferase family protein [Gemmatimonadota bacterium]